MGRPVTHPAAQLHNCTKHIPTLRVVVEVVHQPKSTLSQRPVSPQEEEVLFLKLSFAITPKEIIAATEATSHKLDAKTADALRLGVSVTLQQAKQPRLNLSFKHHQAIRNLRGNPSTTIVSADKGRATVIMESEKYATKMKQILADEKYQVLKWDPTVKVENEIARTEESTQWWHIDDQLYDRLTPLFNCFTLTNTNGVCGICHSTLTWETSCKKQNQTFPGIYGVWCR